MNGFAVRDGELVIGGMTLSALAERVGRTPFYAHDARRIAARVAEVRAAIMADSAVAPADPPPGFLGELRGYHYHSGITFAAYCAGQAQAIALGGRYDEVGKSFGRARPATGFSLDLRKLAAGLKPAAAAPAIPMTMVPA